MEIPAYIFFHSSTIRERITRGTSMQGWSPAQLYKEETPAAAASVKAGSRAK
jgi:hypothetical protein